MLKEGPTPVTAHKAGTEAVVLGREMGRDEGKDIQRNTVYANERVPPLAEIRQCGREVPVELRNVIKGEAVWGVSALPLTGLHERVQDDISRRTEENMPCGSAPRSGQRGAAKARGPFQGKRVSPWGG